MDLVPINFDLPEPITYRGERVLTTDQLARCYGAAPKNIHDNHRNHTGQFAEGVHFFRVIGEDLQALKNHPEFIGLVDKRASHLVLWTERGCLRHAKALETPRAWTVFGQLEIVYFKAKAQVETAATDPIIASMKHLIAVRQAQLEIERRQAEHDQRLAAIEAQQAALPGPTTHMTVLGYANLQGVKMNAATGSRLGKRCAAMTRLRGLMIGSAHDDRYGQVGTYPLQVLEDIFVQERLISLPDRGAA